MSKIILLSKDPVLDSQNKLRDLAVMEVLKKRSEGGDTICMISGRGLPERSKSFPFIQMYSCGFFPSRMSGKYVPGLLEFLAQRGLTHVAEDIVIIGSSNDDFQMATNSLRPLICAEWVENVSEKAQKYGVQVSNATHLENALALFDVGNPWYFEWSCGKISFFALTDANTLHKGADEVSFANGMRNHLKQGNTDFRREYILRFLSCVSQFGDVDYVAVVPSSASKNDKQELMHEYANQARYILTKKKHAKPLLIRHKQAEQRKYLRVNKENPTNQIDTLHLHSSYKRHLEGSTVLLIDDYMTKGVSLSVSASLLQVAGVRKILCVTMGKFGGDLVLAEIEYDPTTIFSTKAGKSAKVKKFHRESGTYDRSAHDEFRKKFASLIDDE